MTRRVHRDPRSLMEVRRLALRAKRIHSQREVLHDVLLETFPREYEKAIDEALEASEKGKEHVVMFMPSRLRSGEFRRMLLPARHARPAQPGLHMRVPAQPSRFMRISGGPLFVVRENPTLGDADTYSHFVERRVIRKLPNIPSFRSAVLVFRGRGFL